MLTALSLAFTLSWDNARTAYGLGAAHWGLRRQVPIALYYATWDAIAPLVGWALGASAVDFLPDWLPRLLGAAGLVGYALFLVIGRAHGEKESPSAAPAQHILAALLSVDNLVGGVAFAALGVSPLAMVAACFVATFSVAFVALRIGGLTGWLVVPRHTQVYGALVLVILAFVMVFGGSP